MKFDLRLNLKMFVGPPKPDHPSFNERNFGERKKKNRICQTQSY